MEFPGQVDMFGPCLNDSCWGLPTMIKDCDSASMDAGLGPLKIPSMDHVEIHPAKAVHRLCRLSSNQPELVGGFNHLEKYESQWEG